MANFSQPTNVSGVGDIFSYANQVTSGVFGYAMLLVVYIVVLMTLKVKGEQTADSMIASGFTTMFVAIFMFFMDVVTGQTLFISILGFGLPLVWKIYK